MELLILFFVVFNMADAQERLPIDRSCHSERDYIYLEKKEKEEIQVKFKLQNLSSIIKRYRINCYGEISYGFEIEDHVKVAPQRLFITIKNKKIIKVDLLSFGSKSKYSPKERWLKSFTGLRPKEVDGMSGASFTTRSTRRILSLVLYLTKE